MTIRAGRGAAAVALALAMALGSAACGGGGGADSGGRTAPKTLGRASSAAEDSIESILAGRRDQAVRSTALLDQLAQGDLPDDLEGIISKEELGELQGRSAELARIAPDGEPIDVALAANHAFELLARLAGHFDSDVPAGVRLLGYCDREAKLRASARELDGVRSAAERLAATWSGVVKAFPAGEKAAQARSRFEAHAAALAGLVAAGTDFDGMVREADHGLALLAEVEAVFAG
ncbi:MAG TPA: hypothetical protein VFS16_08560 [Acidimicrobiia bacterium]|nr:hypothetical protein [Acidimicrobiia bacterium]